VYVTTVPGDVLCLVASAYVTTVPTIH
jgi:hypothetical protein